MNDTEVSSSPQTDVADSADVQEARPKPDHERPRDHRYGDWQLVFVSECQRGRGRHGP